MKTPGEQRAYNRDYNREWRRRNPEKSRAIKQRFNRKNRGKYLAVERAWRHKNGVRLKMYGHTRGLKLYDLTTTEFTRILTIQDGCCALCGRPQTDFKRRLSVDHDHINGMVRGLLCSGCNTGIGNLQDSPELLRRAADYLELSTAAHGVM